MNAEVVTQLLGLTLRPELKEVIDERITQVSLLGDKLLPPKMESAVTGKVNVIKANNGESAHDDEMAPGATANRVTTHFGEDFWSTTRHGDECGTDVTKSIIGADTGIDFEEVAGDTAVDTLLCNRERRIADKVFNDTLFAGADYQVDLTKPLTDVTCPLRAKIKVAAEKIRLRKRIPRSALTLVMNDLNFELACELMEKDEGVKYTTAVGLSTRDFKRGALATWLGVKDIMVGEATYASTGLVNALVTFSDLYPTDFLLLAYLSPASSTWAPGLGRQPVCTKWSRDYLVDSRYNSDTMETVIRATDWRGEYIDKDYGVLLTGAET